MRDKLSNLNKEPSVAQRAEGREEASAEASWALLVVCSLLRAKWSHRKSQTREWLP